MNIELVDDLEDLAPYLQDWRSLASSPMQSPEWMLAWWAAYKTSRDQLLVLVVTDDDSHITKKTVVGLAPLCISNRWGLGSTVRLLGSGDACTDLQQILAASGHQLNVSKAVASFLLNMKTHTWTVCDFDGVPGDCESILAFMECLQEANCSLDERQLESTWRLNLDDGWPGFLTGMSKTQRKQIRNLANRFDKSDDMRIEYVSTSDKFPDAFTTLAQLHQARWAQEEKAGCFADPRFTAFLSAAATDLAARGHAFIATLFLEDQAVACQLILHDENGYYVYQSGRSPQHDSRSVGRIQNIAMIRDACDKDVSFVDYLRGDEIYKARLGAVAKTCNRIRAVTPQLLPQLADGTTSLGREIKRTVMKLVGAS